MNELTYLSTPAAQIVLKNSLKEIQDVQSITSVPNLKVVSNLKVPPTKLLLKTINSIIELT